MNSSEEDMGSAFSYRNAILLFSLVDNVQVISCDMQNGTGTSFSTLSSTYTRERVEQLMGGDVRNYSSNSESLITLIDRVNSNNHVFSSNLV